MIAVVLALALAPAVAAPEPETEPVAAPEPEAPAPPPVEPTAPAQPATAARRLDDPVLADYFAKLAAAGMLDDREATAEQLDALLQRGQEEYVRGNALRSAVLLFELVHSPRYENFRDTPTMSSATYHLGVALQALGADLTATAAYAQVLARGPDDPYFTPALRRHVDLGLAGKDFSRALDDLDRDLHREDGAAIPLVAEDLDEREYLAARAAQQQGRLDEALALYDRVGDKSRFRTAARYLQGLVHAGRRDFRRAESALCQVVGGPKQQSSVYYVDRRYFPVRDLAHLGLGRVAHEELRHGHAFYHYFSVPQDSEELPHALFEAAWTMAEEGEYSVARGLLAELRERFPDAPQTAEARVLEAMLKLYDCDFRTAEKEFGAFIDDMAPVGDHIAEIRRDPAKVRALHRDLVRVRAGGQSARGELAVHRLLLSMMDEDPTYARLARDAEALRAEARFLAAIDRELATALRTLGEKDTAVARDPAGDALDAIAEAAALERGVAGLERQIRQAKQAGLEAAELVAAREQAAALRGRVGRLRTSAAEILLASPPIGSAQSADLRKAVATDRTRVHRLRARALDTAARLDDQAAAVASARLGELSGRIDDMLGEARMGRIDAVLGAKKKLEIEVRDMAAGRFPPELFGKLQIEGVVGDDEEFWPYEGEYWADEYEGYR